LDVRNNEGEQIESLRFSEFDIIKKSEDRVCLELVDDNGISAYNIRYKDIDNMKKALDKARELWENK
jgi:uncharacterized protein with von Willebrand factor type A (vWA) domain